MTIVVATAGLNGLFGEPVGRVGGEDVEISEFRFRWSLQPQVCVVGW